MTTPQPAVPAAHPAMFAALEVPNFRRYVSGQSLSLIGTWVETVAQALLVLRLTHSGIALGLTTAARYAPILLLSPYVPAIIRPLLMMALVGTFTFEFEVSLPLLAETTFHGSSTTYSALLGALGAGAVTGGLYAARSARTGVAPLIRAALGFAIAVGLVAAAPTLATAPGHRLVVDGPGRQHGDRLTGHRRAIGASRPAVWPRPRRRRLPRRRHHRRLARPRHPPRRPQPSGVAGQTRCRPARITRPRSGRCPGVRAQPGAGREPARAAQPGRGARPALPADQPFRAGDRQRALRVGEPSPDAHAAPLRQARRPPPPGGPGPGPYPWPALAPTPTGLNPLS